MEHAKQASALTRNVSAQLLAMLSEEPSQQALIQAYRLLAKWRAQLIENTIVARHGTTITYGPFAGMHYSIRATEGARAARLLGCYEASLPPIIEAIVTKGYETVVDIGCAEGYYAVGLARRMPKAQVLARDTNPKAQDSCRELAELNAVSDRVGIGGEWGHQDFEICKMSKTVVICDIEGGENALLDPSKAPGLLDADILVEVHDCFHPGLSDTIAERFTATHHVTKLNRRIDSDALPEWMEEFSDLDRLTALWEWRAGPTPWLWMERRVD